MGWLGFQEEVRHRLRGQPHLRPTFHHVLDVPRRVWEYGDAFAVAFNMETGRWEVHDMRIREIDDTLAMNVHNLQLDARVMDEMRYHDVRIHGKAILDRMRQGREAWERRRQRQARDHFRAVNAETRRLWAKEAWGDGGQLLWGYKPGLERGTQHASVGSR